MTRLNAGGRGKRGIVCALALAGTIAAVAQAQYEGPRQTAEYRLSRAEPGTPPDGGAIDTVDVAVDEAMREARG